MNFRDRIKELRRVPASQIVPAEANYRVHPDSQRAELQKLLESIGFAGAVLCREGDDGRLHCCDGHLRNELAGDEEVPVLVTDLTEAEAKQVLLTYDAVGTMALADEGKLKALMDDCAGGGMAFGDDMLAALHGMDLMAEPTEPDPPEEFKELGEDIETQYRCPKCQYEWSGQPGPGKVDDSVANE